MACETIPPGGAYTTHTTHTTPIHLYGGHGRTRIATVVQERGRED